MTNQQAMSGPVVLMKAYLELCKPRVVLLMIITAMVGMVLAVTGPFPWSVFIFGNLGIGFCASSAAIINHLVDRHIDQKMRRTARRPLVQGLVTPVSASIFSFILAVIGMALLLLFVNGLTAILTFLTLIGYAVIYTLYLKHATSQNIVIGGAAGAAPPLLGWVAITGHLDPQAWLLMSIIFVWTPPHFWALAIAKVDEYKKANVPMLPCTHGVPFTKTCILLYTLLLIAVSLLPFVVAMSGWIYLIGIVIFDAIFLFYAIKLYRVDSKPFAMKLFWYSIYYLFALFILLIIDHLV